MPIRWVLQARYTLRRNTVSIMKGLVGMILHRC